VPSSVLLKASRSPRARKVVTAVPVTRRVVNRFVAGETQDAALAAVRSLKGRGLLATLDHLGEDTRDETQAAAIRDSYVSLLRRLGEAGLADAAEVSLKLSALGQALPNGGEQIALANARAICEAAAAVGTTVTLDMEDHTTIDSTLRVLGLLREQFPWVGAVLQAMLLRTEQDCRDLAVAGSRVRLVKGAYAEPASVAHQGKSEVDAAYVRCLEILMAGGGYPMVGSHDPRMIAAARAAVSANGRTAADHEFQMLFGIRQDEQLALARDGRRMRVYVPFGVDWYGYFMRRLAERPANVGFFLRALVGR
jgi:proline dehydrogenase